MCRKCIAVMSLRAESWGASQLGSLSGTAEQSEVPFPKHAV